MYYTCALGHVSMIPNKNNGCRVCGRPVKRQHDKEDNQTVVPTSPSYSAPTFDPPSPAPAPSPSFNSGGGGGGATGDY